MGTDSEGLAVDRQRKAIHKLIAEKGWTVGKEYLENDTSASGKVPRPQYAQMLADHADGSIEAIAAWKLDRLWRVPKELEHIIELVKKTALIVATVDGQIDLATSQAQTMARVFTAFAQDELDRRSDRQKARFAQDREAGKDHWRGRRPFGLTLEGKAIPEEKKALEDVAELLLNDGTISAAVALLNSRGILTSFNRPWERAPLRRVIQHPRVAGLREHEGGLIKGNWDACLDRDTWDSVRAKLSTPNRPKPKRHDREYLLSGLLTCGECGNKVYGIPSRRNLADGSIRLGYIYRCGKTHISKSMIPMDDLVIMRTLAALAATDYPAVEVDKKALQGLRQARAHELKDWSEWMKEATEEGLRPAEIRPARDKHEARLAEIDRKITTMEKVSLVRLPSLEEIADAKEADNGEIELIFDWDALSLEKRRSLVTAVWESITILPGKKGDRWDDSRVVFVAK